MVDEGWCFINGFVFLVSGKLILRYLRLFRFNLGRTKKQITSPPSANVSYVIFFIFFIFLKKIMTIIINLLSHPEKEVQRSLPPARMA